MTVATDSESVESNEFVVGFFHDIQVQIVARSSAMESRRQREPSDTHLHRQA